MRQLQCTERTVHTLVAADGSKMNRKMTSDKGWQLMKGDIIVKDGIFVPNYLKMDCRTLCKSASPNMSKSADEIERLEGSMI